MESAVGGVTDGVVGELVAKMKGDGKTVLTPLPHGHREVVIARAPGRLDVMGGIVDYAGGLVCEMPVGTEAAVAVQRRDDRRVVVKSYNEAGGVDTVELSLDDFYGTAALLSFESLQGMFTGAKHWAAYFAGAYPVLAKHKKITRRTAGANIACYSSVPAGAGVASSAAIACATLTALTAAYHLILDPLEIAVLAQKVENQIAGAPCGVMDPVTAVLGRKGQLLLLDCRPHEVEGFLAVPKGYRIVGIDSGVRHRVAGEAYRKMRVSSFMAQAILGGMYRELGVKKDAKELYLARISPEVYRKYLSKVLPEKIAGKVFLENYGMTGDRATVVEAETDYFPRAAGEHHVYENARVRAFVGCMRKMGEDVGMAATAGKLMLESHRSYSENARLGSAETDVLVELVMGRGVEKGLYGAKITGGGGGGTVAVLAADTDAVRGELDAICGEYKKRTGLEAKVIEGSADGAAEGTVVKMGLSDF